jgi:tetratricopeptide (TPR) repeat protein
MKRATGTALLIGFTLLVSPALRGAGAPGSDAAQTQMASVRELYASASYEEALNVLASVNGSDPATSIEAEQYRALCLLAIGRQGEARLSVRRIVEQDPLYVPAETDVSPRIAALFSEARRDLLPALAKRQFADAKALYERQDHQLAATVLDRVLRIASDPAIKDAAGIEDLRLVADGLLTLARAKIAATPPPAPAPPPAPVAPPPPVVYSGDDPTVTVPVAITQEMPVWRATGPLRNGAVLSGLMRLVVSESGTVENVTLLRAVHPMYDGPLVKAAHTWTFKPAMKDGQPVKYAKVIQVQLKE